MKTEQIEKVLSLQLDWIKSADGKVPIIFGINVAMLGVIVALIKMVSTWDIILAIVVTITLILLIVSTTFVACTAFPRLSGPKGSNIFFGGIANQDIEKYISDVKKFDESDYETDLLSQIHRNAEIAKAKYGNVKNAFVALFISAPFWLWSIYLLYV